MLDIKYARTASRGWLVASQAIAPNLAQHQKRCRAVNPLSKHAVAPTALPYINTEKSAVLNIRWG
ncbi:MAG: hypothetical protein PUP93_29125 [Rhizonema sp. NSF051]|nr:hypothetical protein [Rhizonema sp. NSF051]